MRQDLAGTSRRHRIVLASAAIGGFSLLLWNASALAMDLDLLGLDESVIRSIGHMLAYGLLTLLIGFSLGGRWFVAALIAAALGGVEEWYQLYVPGRYATLNDWLLDVTGVIIAVCLARLVHNRSSRLPPAPPGTAPARRDVQHVGS